MVAALSGAREVAGDAPRVSQGDGIASATRRKLASSKSFRCLPLTCATSIREFNTYIVSY
jgi:hypothetical protein